MSTESLELARRLSAIERRLNQLVPDEDLGSSSIEDTRVNEYELIFDPETGEYVRHQIASIWGRQWDGTHGNVTVAGPPPPQPAGAGITLTPTPGGIIVRYDGTWQTPFTVAPMDFSHFEVHVDDSEAFSGATFDTLRGTINTARGGNVVVPWPTSSTPLYARVVARSTSGKASEPSALAGPVTSGTAPRIFPPSPDMPAPLGANDTGVWWDSDDDNAPYYWLWDDVTNMGAWTLAPYGTGAIGPNSLVASDVLATGTITAPLFAAVLVLASTLLGGEPNGFHATMSAAGIELWALNPDGVSVRVGGLGTGDDAITFVDPATAETTFSVTRAGRQTTKSLDIQGEDLDGDGKIDGGFSVYGRTFIDWLDDSPRGGNGSAFYLDALNGVFASGISTPFGLGEVSFDSYAGRHYLTIFDGLHFSSSAGSMRGLLTFKYTTDGTAPSLTNGTRAASKFFYIPAAGEAHSAPPVMRFGVYTGTDGALVRVGLQVQRFAGSSAGSTLTCHTYSGGEDFRAPFRFFNLDVGRDIPDTYIPNDMGGTRGDYTTSPTPAPTKKTYTSTWQANFLGSYLGNDSRSHLNGAMYQGQSPFYTAGGNQKALAGFTANATSGETGKTIQQALSGATVNQVEIYLQCDHSHYHAGGTARIGYHGNVGAPVSAPAASFATFGNASFKQGQGRWINLPSSTFADWKSGTYKGITVGPGVGSDPIYYMRFVGGLTSGYRPAIRIRYTR